jgi:hypothetical protein
VRFARLPSEPLALAWTPDGTKLLAACADGHVRAVEPDSAAVAHDFAALNGIAYTLAVHPAGKQAVVGGARGELKIVELLKMDEGVRETGQDR